MFGYVDFRSRAKRVVYMLQRQRDLGLDKWRTSLKKLSRPILEPIQ